MLLRLSSAFLVHVRNTKRPINAYLVRVIAPVPQAEESKKYVGTNGFSKIMRLHVWRGALIGGGAVHVTEAPAAPHIKKSCESEKEDSWPRFEKGRFGTKGETDPAYGNDENNHSLCTEQWSLLRKHRLNPFRSHLRHISRLHHLKFLYWKAAAVPYPLSSAAAAALAAVAALVAASSAASSAAVAVAVAAPL